MITFRLVLVLVALSCTITDPASAQFGDIAGTWGRKRAVEAGAGMSFSLFGQPIRLLGGIAAVERGLEPPYVWVEEKTRIIDPADPEGPYYNPEDVRTTPELHGWARVEWSPSWLGVSAMLDPREYTGAAGVFGSYDITTGSAIIGELRWAHHFGFDFSVRLRFQ